jgi:hypothetical protein
VADENTVTFLIISALIPYRAGDIKTGIQRVLVGGSSQSHQPQVPGPDFSRVNAMNPPPFILPLILLVIHPP